MNKVISILLFVFSFSIISSLVYFNFDPQLDVSFKEPERRGPELSMSLSEEDMLEREVFYLEKKLEEKDKEIEELKDVNNIKDWLIGLSGFILNILSILGIVKKRKAVD